jgi:hypothetical protein
MKDKQPTPPPETTPPRAPIITNDPIEAIRLRLKNRGASDDQIAAIIAVRKTQAAGEQVTPDQARAAASAQVALGIRPAA